MPLTVDENSLEHGVLSLVVTLAEVIQEALDRQALRRINGGDLGPEEAERLADALLELDEAMEQIKEDHGIVHLGRRPASRTGRGGRRRRGQADQPAALGGGGTAMTDTTALYVYALVPDRPGAADGVTGLDGRPLRLVAVAGTGVAALVHDGEPEPLQGGDEQVHRWVEEQSHAVTTVWERTGSALPMTFNVLVADEPPPGNGPGPGRGAEQRLTDWITSQASSLTNRLQELAGRCELRVEITLDRPAAPTTTPAQGTAATSATETRSPGMLRLLGKQRARNAAGELADTLHARVRHRLLSVAEDLRDRAPTQRTSDETHVLSAALLVRHEDVDAVGTVLSRTRAEQPACRVRFLGPWPPYSFADTEHRFQSDEVAGEPPGRAPR
ncbi:GvpL/GvpF family gas vesicle protein [Streptomyces tendae]|uniref:GvpL/GvpF family gas vesicle protein n=1 Tax=Streptomyces tendae TaxID=1932 RepID=UPI0036C49992